MNDHKSREENTFDLCYALCRFYYIETVLMHSRALMKGGVGQFSAYLKVNAPIPRDDPSDSFFYYNRSRNVNNAILR